MDYLTQYYKTRSEQLQEELNYLNSLNLLYERQSLGNPTVGNNQFGRNRVPAGSAGPKPGVRPPTRVPFEWHHEWGKPVMPPYGLDPGHPLPSGKHRPPAPWPNPQIPGPGNQGGWPVDPYGNPYAEEQRPGGPGYGPYYPLR